MAGTLFDLPTVGGFEDDVPPGHAARLEQTLLQARALIESTVSLHRRRPATVSGLTHMDAEVTTETLERLVLRAKRSVNVALAGSVTFAESALRCLTGVPSGVTVRVLCSPATLEVAPARLRGLPAVRVFPHELCGFVTVDGASAFLRLGAQGATDDRAAVVTDRAAVSTLQLLYAGVWARGRRLVDHPEPSPRLRSDLTRRILEQLRSGRTDANAAGELQVSLRTYRRHVAEIMRELNASSRFQAGVRAVELGLLPKGT
ncbi:MULTISPECIES: DNA-binding response regulator [unclassified Streptomyces]|uniref:helix-turn-helix transcriptional regulator n=1 Tax=unclassified Streptomyces TaxID=2593676 RepID=UPI0036FEFDCC